MKIYYENTHEVILHTTYAIQKQMYNEIETSKRTCNVRRSHQTTFWTFSHLSNTQLLSLCSS